MNRRSVATPIVTPQQSEGDGRSSSYDTSSLQFSAEFIDKLQTLRASLEEDLLGCDAKWTLFVAAALSYRYDTQLKPFPQRYVNEQMGYNIDGLISVINETPKLSVVLQHIMEENFEEFDTEVLDLLHYVLVLNRSPVLRLVDDEEFDIFLRSIGQNFGQVKPTHIFEVCKSLRTTSEENFRCKSIEFPTKFAFHGNKLDSFFILLNRGSRVEKVEEVAVLEEPICLVPDLAASLNLSPNGAGWGASNCGALISCVALCEYVNNPQYIHIFKNKISVTASDFFRVRYLLFYGSRCPRERKKSRNTVFGWVRRNKYSLSLACYLLLLASIGVANSGSGQYWRNVVSKKVNILLDFCRRLSTVD